ncbi:hypothetical protein Nepgr_030051 [Nepenthes gracilis]|uniref:Uncharacterized protein n=1 Tax=Nepenthes gracilis TaxID=150966 RepID=A0AAD3TFN6_NEPGR|nr:hypothetical protein Nepgr_030051 [Nepenthes gracilis]
MESCAVSDPLDSKETLQSPTLIGEASSKSSLDSTVEKDVAICDGLVERPSSGDMMVSHPLFFAEPVTLVIFFLFYYASLFCILCWCWFWHSPVEAAGLMVYNLRCGSAGNIMLAVLSSPWRFEIAGYGVYLGGLRCCFHWF